ncbi:MAG TPA: hypothetical protein VHY22_11220 [Chthoniobacteraceae bacterium]|jgi:hypothetical protein|nr:hypothetical protein [Chthoniobacteraceae bacterium]
MKHLPSIFIAALVLFGAVSQGAAPNEEDLPHVRADGRRLMFGWHGGSPHRVDVSNLIRAATLDTVKVLTAQTNGDVDYFVVTVSGPSRTGSPNGSTTSSTESNLLWLKLRSWKLLDAQSLLYQSYWDFLQPVGDYHIKGGVLTLRFANLRESTNYVLRYDSSKPEAKIEIQRAGDVE